MNTSFFLPHGKVLAVAIMACLAFIQGCTSLHPVNIAVESERTVIAKGDTVVITTDSGQVHTFKIVDITAGGLHGKELSVPYSDIRLLQIRRVNMQKTILLTASIIGLGVIANGDDGDSGDGY